MKCISKSTDTSTPAPRYPLHLRVNDKRLQKESSGSWGARVNANTHLVPTPPATQGSSRGSARPQGGCILAGSGILSCPEPLRTWDTEGPPPLSLLRWLGPWFCAQLAGSVAAGAEGTAGLESWGTFGAASGWGRPGEVLCWVKRSGAPARAWQLSTSGWDPPPGRPTSPPRSSLMLHALLSLSTLFSHP